LLHVRVATDPPLDLLGVYQHAWNPSQKDLTGSSAQKVQELVRRRASIWTQIRGWCSSVPKRNSLLILGDFNGSLRTMLPRVGSGVALHKDGEHPDQEAFQRLVSESGLVAVNTWGRYNNKAGTFLPLHSQPVQIDFILIRLPCQPHKMCARTLPEAPVTPPSGMRHMPVECFLPRPSLAHVHRTRAAPTSQQVNASLQHTPGLAGNFLSQLQLRLAHESRNPVPFDEIMQQAWLQARSHIPEDKADSSRFQVRNLELTCNPP